MTKIVVTEIKDGKKPSNKEIKKQLSKMIEGAANKDGTWKKGWQPALLQSYIKRLGEGKYEVVHNLNNNKYALSISTIKGEGGCFLLEQNNISFIFEIKKGDANIDADFRFAMSVIDG
jgi:hypothetical protein